MKMPQPSKSRGLPAKPEDVIDFLYQLGSNIHVIPLANMMWDEEEDMSFVRDNKLLLLWNKELASIRQNCQKDLETWKNNMKSLNICSDNFLSAFDRRSANMGVSLLKKIDQLQNNIYRFWQSQLPKNAFFPALELLFREGEIIRFQDIIKSLKKRVKKPFQVIRSKLKKELKELPPETSNHNTLKKYQDHYQFETRQAIQSVEHLLNFILSFYDRKWSLLLSAEKGKDAWIQR